MHSTNDVYNTDWSQHFQGKTILITGASGLIGSHLMKKTLEAGANVHGTSRVQRESTDGNMTWWQGTFEDYEAAKKLIKQIKPDIIFQMAGEATASNDLSFVLPTYHSLLTSSIVLMTVAAELGCERIVLTGSSTEPLESHPYPNSPYSAAKWVLNSYRHLFHRLYQLPVTYVRPFMGYGPGQSKSKLIPHVILSLLRGESPKLTNGLWVTDWVYIDDTVEGILAATVTRGLESETIDLGSGILTSVREIIEKIVDIMKPEAKPLFGALPDRHAEHTRLADTEHTYQMIGWRARTPLDEGLARTIEYYKTVS